MELAASLGLATLILALGLLLFIVVVNSLDQQYLTYFLSAGALGAIAGLLIVLLALNIVSGFLFIPGLAATVTVILLAGLAYNIGVEQRFLYRQQQRKAPINISDVNRGLNWRQVEKWLQKQEDR